MKKIVFIETPIKLTVKDLVKIKGGVDACTGYSGSCVNFDECKSGFTGSCSIIYETHQR